MRAHGKYYRHWQPELKKSLAKDIVTGTNPLIKVLGRGRHWVRDPTHRRAIKEKSIDVNRDWVKN